MNEHQHIIRTSGLQLVLEFTLGALRPMCLDTGIVTCFYPCPVPQSTLLLSKASVFCLFMSFIDLFCIVLKEGQQSK